MRAPWFFLAVAPAFSWSAGHAAIVDLNPVYSAVINSERTVAPERGDRAAEARGQQLAFVTPNQRAAILYGNNGPSWSPPPDPFNYVAVLGDSRTNNCGGLSGVTSGVTWGGGYGFSNGWCGWLPLLSGGSIAYESFFNYGVGAQTTAGIAARVKSAQNDCNDSSQGTTNSCISGVQTTLSSTYTAGTTVINVASSAGMAAGDNVSYALVGNPLTTIQTVNSSTQITVTPAMTATENSGSALMTSHQSKTNQFWNFTNSVTNPTGWGQTDPDFNRASNGLYSPCSDPAKIVAVLGGVNDVNFPNVLTSLKNTAYILDTLGPKGCGKSVVLLDEIPNGVSTQVGQPETVPGSPYQFTPTVPGSGTSFYNNVAVYYAPAGTAGGSGLPTTLGANDGVALTWDNPTYGACSSPATGHYCVTSGGQYTFAAGDTGIQMAMYYTYKGSAAGSYLHTIHDYDISTAKVFIDPVTLVNYGIPGALYKRPWVYSAKSHEAVVDPASGSNYYNLPWTGQENVSPGLHPAPHGGYLVSTAVMNALKTIPGLNLTTPQFPLPAVGQGNVGFSGNSTGTVGTVNAHSCGASVDQRKTLQLNNPNVNTGLYQTGMTLFMTGSVGLAGAKITCIDNNAGTANILVIDTAATGVSTNVGSLASPSGGASLMTDGLFIQTPVTTTNTNCGTTDHCDTPHLYPVLGGGGSICSSGCTTASKGYPNSTILSIDSATKTSLNNGTAYVAYGIETNPLSDGYNDWATVLGGISSTSGTSITLTFQTSNAANAQFSAGHLYRAQCYVTLDKGPNGRFQGLTQVKMQLNATSSVAYTPQGVLAPAGTNYTIYQGIGGSGSTLSSVNLNASTYEFSPGDESQLPMSFPVSTNWVDTTGMTAPISMGVSFIESTDAGRPMSVTARIGKCTMGQAGA